jgi:hypothetical protein
MTESFEPLSGGCACGQVRYKVVGEPLFTHACHCSDCQRTTGSAFVLHTVIAKDDLEIEGETKATTLPTGSGAGYDPHFCINCGTYIWCKYHFSAKGVIVIRSGTLDDTTLVEPQAHVFTRYKLPWMTLPTDVPVFEEFFDREKVYPKESFERWTELVNKYG